MHIQLKRILRLSIIVAFAAAIGCGPKTPVVAPPPAEPGPTPLQTWQQEIPKDATIYQALKVLENYGRKSKKSISYNEYKKNTGGSTLTSWSPEWFYDAFTLELNEKGNWVTVTWSTSKFAGNRDPRIAELMKDAPSDVIDLKVKVPSGRTYLLGDSDADGILDFAMNKNAKAQEAGKQANIQLLDQMQKKYAWILSIIKRNYKYVRKSRRK